MRTTPRGEAIGVDTGRDSLGKWLSTNKGKVFNGLRIVHDVRLEGVARYRLQRRSDDGWEYGSGYGGFGGFRSTHL